MKKISDEHLRTLVLIKLDAKNLFNRIKWRAPEYLAEFSLKRTREHFKEIFYNRYEAVQIRELAFCSEEVIINLDQFYNLMDEMRWYLNHTQDMPNRVDDKISSYIRELETIYQTLDLYIEAEVQTGRDE